MKSKALGLIEAVGMPAAVEAADAALKAANVTLVGYEKARGGGWITIKIRGDVGAVKAAVEAGVAAASKVNAVRSFHVIPNPHEDTELLAGMVERGPAAKPPKPPASPEQPAPKAGKKPDQQKGQDQPGEATAAEVAVIEAVLEAVVEAEVEAEVEAAIEAEVEAVIEAEVEAEIEAAVEADLEAMAEAIVEAEEEAVGDVCNLCNDPACPRRKGQPRKFCIHWESEEGN